MNDILWFFFVSHLMIGIASVSLGTFVLSKARSRINILFALLVSSIALWGFFYAFWIATSDMSRALMYSRALNFFAVFIPVFYVHWLLLFLKKEVTHKIFLGVAYVSTAFFALFGFSDVFVGAVAPVLFFEYYPQSYWLHSAFLFMWAVIILYSVFLLSAQLFKAVGNERDQIFFILIGSVIGFGGGSFNFLLMFGIEWFAPYASALVLLVPLLLGYAMMKYNLMDIRLVFIKSLIILLNVFAVGFIFVSNSMGEYIAKIFFAIMILVLSYFLQQSFDKEIAQKDELLKLSNELKRANEELKRLDKAKSEFISIASHQLRTPLTAIKGYISLILEGAYGETSDKTEDALNKIFLANERLIQLVEDLLNITRIESGRLEYHFEDNVQMEDILNELHDMFILRTQEKGLDFAVQLPEEKTARIKADVAKLREVISNLIDNAVKYTDEGFVHVSLVQKKNAVRVIVEDSGVGISEESMKTLFAKFSRGTDSTKIYTEGTGLGLYVGKNLVESQGGSIEVKSDGTGKGSQFIIEMPVNGK